MSRPSLNHPVLNFGTAALCPCPAPHNHLCTSKITVPFQYPSSVGNFSVSCFFSYEHELENPMFLCLM